MVLDLSFKTRKKPTGKTRLLRLPDGTLLRMEEHEYESYLKSHPESDEAKREAARRASESDSSKQKKGSEATS